MDRNTRTPTHKRLGNAYASLRDANFKLRTSNFKHELQATDPPQPALHERPGERIAAQFSLRARKLASRRARSCLPTRQLASYFFVSSSFFASSKKPRALWACG